MVLRAPLDILFTYPAIVIGLVHAYLPYAILTIYVSLQAIDDSLIEASRSLGATRWQAFRRIMLPLSMPGVLAGVFLIFVPVIGSFMEPRILGGKQASCSGRSSRASSLSPSTGRWARRCPSSCWRSCCSSWASARRSIKPYLEKSS